MTKGHDGNKGNPEEVKHSEVKQRDSARSSSSKGHSPLPDGCFSWGCKAQAARFNFCSEHYDQFKFGIIKKTGEPVLDYEKKIEHFMAYKAKRGVRKVA